MFKILKEQIAKKFAELAQHQLYYVQVDRDLIWEKYITGFTNPIEQQTHNCNACKSFLRQYGGIVAIIDNKVVSLWDIEADGEFALPVKQLSKYVHSLPVTDVLLNDFAKLGTDKNIDRTRSVVWEHFYVQLPKQYVHKGATSLDTALSEARDNKAVLKRSLDELAADAVATTLDLIAQGSLYRGNEFTGMLEAFKALQTEYEKVPAKLKHNFCWAKSVTVGPALCRIRNTSIGTLLINLSEGMELDKAVDKFEAVVAPTNYKRPSALVTPKMVETAKAKLEELGMLEALDRRFAQPTDLNIKDILFVDKSSSLKDVFEDIKKDAQVNPKQLTKVEEIGVEDFITNVLPTAKALHVLLENNHLNKMVTLLTATNGAPNLFKWNNPFSWAYTGGITDAIKERVKAAGGKVDGELRVSLSWNNYDDLDLHAHEPGGEHIHFAYKRSYITGGTLDVDMNAGSGTTRTPVENIIWPDVNNMRDGLYRIIVHNFAKREVNLQGFTVQLECRGEVYDWEFRTNPRNNEYHPIVEFHYTKKDGVKLPANVQSTVVNKDKWGLKTNRFHKVKNVLLSPNHWDSAIGNKHYLFILEGCASDEPTRPFFNEFLKEEFTPHKKFFEVLGSKLKLEPASNQLSGLGFSDTQRSSVVVQVQGTFKRLLKINF